jgi:hypothetical protein
MNVTPSHFYSDLPEMRHLRSSDYWRRPFSMEGVNGADVDEQLEFLRRCCQPYSNELQDLALYEQACIENDEPGFGPIEALVLYAYVRSRKPSPIVQIGCGVTTAIILAASRAEHDYVPQILCIDPVPTALLKRLAAQGHIQLLPKMAQTVPIETFAEVGSDGLLFIDSSHSLRVGSEVVLLINEVLPHLPAGAGVHFHDIYFPYDYSPQLLSEEIFFWRETTLLYAMLSHNPRLRIDMSLSMLHNARAEEMKALIPPYQPRPMHDGLATGAGHYPSSCYLRVM